MAETTTAPDTTNNPKPVLRPADPRFSCGPVKKYPGWTWEALADAPLSRTHRAGTAVARIKESIERTHAMLELPADYHVALLPGSDTGAMEAAMWSLLGQRGTDVFSWDVFGNRWTHDARDELKLKDLRIFQTPAGQLPDLARYDGKRDAVFTLNGTAAGVCIPDFDWIDADREGLTICDATSAAFAVEIDLFLAEMHGRGSPARHAGDGAARDRTPEYLAAGLADPGPAAAARPGRQGQYGSL